MSKSPRKAELIGEARAFRRLPTRGEDALWPQLRGMRLGVRFRRQHVLGPFIADFACPAHRLIVEVDGGVHLARSDRDHLRDAYFDLRGFRVLRLPDDLVQTDLHAALGLIRAVLDEQSPTKPQTS